MLRMAVGSVHLDFTEMVDITSATIYDVPQTFSSGIVEEIFMNLNRCKK